MSGGCCDVKRRQGPSCNGCPHLRPHRRPHATGAPAGGRYPAPPGCCARYQLLRTACSSKLALSAFQAPAGAHDASLTSTRSLVSAAAPAPERGLGMKLRADGTAR